MSLIDIVFLLTVATGGHLHYRPNLLSSLEHLEQTAQCYAWLITLHKSP